MPKNLLQDMVKVKSVRKIRPREIPKKEERVEPHIDKFERVDFMEVENIKNKSPRRYTLWIVALACVVVLFFALSCLFARATVSINPKVVDVTLNESLSATKDSSPSGDLLYHLVVINGEENKLVQATDTKEILQKAQGTILIYNAYSTAPQPLSIDTRLEGSNGKMYKTLTKITVPGMKKDGTPGSVEVGVYGADGGAEYNSTPIDFKLFGFKGTPKYSKFYGRSKGEITGGFKGLAPFISAGQQESVVNEMKTTLQTKLLKEVIDETPPGFILFKDAVFLNTDPGSVDLANAQGNAVPITLKGTLYGLLFDKQQLTAKIAQDNIDKYDGSDVYIPKIGDLIFTLTSKDAPSLGDAQNINFNLTSPAKIVWKVDSNKLATALLGRSKKDFNQLLVGYPNITSATLSITPPWRMSLPDKSKYIKIIVNYPE